MKAKINRNSNRFIAIITTLALLVGMFGVYSYSPPMASASDGDFYVDENDVTQTQSDTVIDNKTLINDGTLTNDDTIIDTDTLINDDTIINNDNGVDPAVIITFPEDADYYSMGMFFVDFGDENVDLLYGVTAMDENGEPVEVSIVNYVGFDVYAEFPDNVFTVTYGAIHPGTDETTTRERTVVVVMGIMPLSTDGIPFIDADGNRQNHTGPITIHNSGGGVINFTSGWHLLTGTHTRTGRSTVTSGNVHIILADGADWTFGAGINAPGGNSLTIYAQSTGNNVGRLTANRPSLFPAAIGGNAQQTGGMITINGGLVTGHGDWGAGIGGGDGGGGGTVTINGGMVTATGNGIGGGGNQTGRLTVSGNAVVYATRLGINERNITGGILFEGNNGRLYGNVTLESDLTIPTDHVLRIQTGITLAIPDGITLTNNGTVINHGTIIGTAPDGITLTNNGTIVNYGTITGTVPGGITLTNNEIIVDHGTIIGNVLHNPPIIPISVTYLDANGEQQQTLATVHDATLGVLTPGWHLLRGTGELSVRQTISGDVHIVLEDGADWTFPRGIHLTDNNSLTIYAQSTGDNMGELTVGSGVVGDHAGIGGGFRTSTGNITINGGKVNVTGGNRSAGIGGGYFGTGGNTTINGGTVIARGGGSYGAGIGGGNQGAGGNIIITGGSVTATGGVQAAGIGGGDGGAGGNITITGGSVTATGGGQAAGIGGGIGGAGGNITITGGEINATGGNHGAGIGGGNDGIGGSITISGGTITATGRGTSGGIGGGGTNLTGSLTMSGNALVYVNRLNINHRDIIGGILFDGNGGTVYGNTALRGDLTISDIHTLTVQPDATLTIPFGITLTNYGTITNEGRIINNGTIINSGTITNSGQVITRPEDITGNPIQGSKTIPLIDITAINSDESGNGWSFDGTILTIYGGANVYITSNNQSTNRHITVAGNTSATITLRNVAIDTASAIAPIYLQNGANLRLYFEGNNTLTANNAAGIAVSSGREITITGHSGASLTASSFGVGAGIGGNGTNEDAGTININGIGAVIAVSGSGGSGQVSAAAGAGRAAPSPSAATPMYRQSAG